MYSEGDYDKMPPFSVPEVLTARLESVVLQIKLLAGGGVHPKDFGFVDCPPLESLEAALHQLKQVTTSDCLLRLSVYIWTQHLLVEQCFEKQTLQVEVTRYKIDNRFCVLNFYQVEQTQMQVNCRRPWQV